MFRRVGRELVQNEAEWRRQLGRKRDGRALEAEPPRVATRVSFQLAPRQGPEFSAPPFGIDQQSVGVC